MDTKLTLKLNQDIIKNAKKYAFEKQVSLSRIIENYLQSLTIDSTDEEIKISPFVKSISTGPNKIPTDIDYKKEYSGHLIEKYK